MKIDFCLVGNKLVFIEVLGWLLNDGLGYELSYYYIVMMFYVENVIIE